MDKLAHAQVGGDAGGVRQLHTGFEALLTQPVTGIGYILPMPNDALLWNAPRPSPRTPRPGEKMWSMTKNGKRVDAELREYRQWRSL